MTILHRSPVATTEPLDRREAAAFGISAVVAAVAGAVALLTGILGIITLGH